MFFFEWPLKTGFTVFDVISTLIGVYLKISMPSFKFSVDPDQLVSLDASC